jgi:hypothetical protein
MTPTDKYLAEVKERAAAATSGPWEICPGDGSVGTSSAEYGPNNNLKMEIADITSARWTDSEFIANAREDIPRLVAMVEAARKALDYYSEYIGNDERGVQARKAIAEFDRIAGKDGT